MKKYILKTVGFAAFAIGGLLAKNQAEEAFETLEKILTKKD